MTDTVDQLVTAFGTASYNVLREALDIRVRHFAADGRPGDCRIAVLAWRAFQDRVEARAADLFARWRVLMDDTTPDDDLERVADASSSFTCAVEDAIDILFIPGA